MALSGLSFAPGLRIQAEVWSSLRSPISRPALDSDSFVLVAAFGRSKFKLCSASAGSLLQAAIGGLAEHFRVSSLSDRVFKFFVASRSVGFFIFKLGSFSCEQFKVSFHLWGNGGPNWRLEYKLFLAEEERSWSYVSHSNSAQKSFADAVRSPPLSGANCIPLGNKHFEKRNVSSVFSRIIFPCRSVFDRLKFDHVFSKSARSMPNPSGQSSVLPACCPRCLSLKHSRRNCR